MASLNGFDATKVEPSTGFDPLPEGSYVCAITESEMMPNSKGTGKFLALKFQVIEGQYKNRILFANLNLQNPTQKAVEIAQAELSAICRAVGVLTPNDSMELHNLPLILKVGLKKREDTGEIKNVIKSYHSKSAAQQQPAAAVPANGSTSAPWLRKSA